MKTHMLMASVPWGEWSGKCRINGKQVDYKLKPGEFAFRSDDKDNWDRRAILNATANEATPPLVTYYCESAKD